MVKPAIKQFWKSPLVTVAIGLAVVATVWAGHPLPSGEDFDGVTPPALPTGWATSQPTNLGSVAAWVSSSTSPDFGANDAFSPSSTDKLDNIMDSVSFTGSANTVVLSFRQSYNLESGFDGRDVRSRLNGIDPAEDLPRAHAVALLDRQRDESPHHR